MLKNVGKKVLKVETDRSNEAIKYLKYKSFTETNNLIRTAIVLVAEQIGLKKEEHRKKNEPRWKHLRHKEAETLSQLFGKRS